MARIECRAQQHQEGHVRPDRRPGEADDRRRAGGAEALRPARLHGEVDEGEGAEPLSDLAHDLEGALADTAGGDDEVDVVALVEAAQERQQCVVVITNGVDRGHLAPGGLGEGPDHGRVGLVDGAGAGDVARAGQLAAGRDHGDAGAPPDSGGVAPGRPGQRDEARSDARARGRQDGAGSDVLTAAPHVAGRHGVDRRHDPLGGRPGGAGIGLLDRDHAGCTVGDLGTGHDPRRLTGTQDRL